MVKKTEKRELVIENELEGGNISLKYSSGELGNILDIWIKGDNTISLNGATKDRLKMFIDGLTEVYEAI